MKKLIFLIFLPLILGCATIHSSKFSQLQIGMSKQEVKKILGNPYLYRAANDSQETWEYNVYAPSNPEANTLTGAIPYWVTFADNKLTFYGRPGDLYSSISKKER